MLALVVPDDLAALITLPTGQVDYLSHNWQEEDVWRSWRNMTKQKNEIANGIRLENASWRTWWKQRNNLKTVSPETLNWLKDSDVTWLYGPIHTAITPPTTTTNTPSTLPTKPILKHRTITDLLTTDLPTPRFTPNHSDDEDDDEDDEEPQQHPPSQPRLLRTKSDTNITRWGSWGGNRMFRTHSPPRVHAPRHTHLIHLASGSRDTSPGTGRTGHRKKKHISFNTFVEQCIAIEKPKKLSLSVSPSLSPLFFSQCQLCTFPQFRRGRTDMVSAQTLFSTGFRRRGG
jgi:hypothetical protein